MKKNLLLLMSSLLFSLVVAEISVRVFKLAPELVRIQPNMERSVHKLSDNPILGYEYKKNYKAVIQPHTYTFSETNSHGLRDIERQYQKPDDVIRVLLVGDSVVAGTSINELDDMINRHLVSST
jgi:hypothetical protein